MNKKRIMKLDIMAIVIMVTILFIATYQFKYNEIEKAESMYGKQDIIIKDVQDFKNISFSNVENYAISKEYPEKNINSINGKAVFGTALIDVDKNYFDMYSYDYQNKAVKNNNVLISERLAKYLKVGIGDKIDCQINNKNVSYTVSAIVNNKLYVDNEDKIYIINDDIPLGKKTNMAVTLKNIDKGTNVLKNNAKYKIIKNDSLISSKKEYLNLMGRSMYIVLFIALLIISLFILNTVYDTKERNDIGVKRILGGSCKQLINEYSMKYFKISLLYSCISIFIGLVISQLMCITLSKKLYISKVDIGFLVVMFLCSIFIVSIVEKGYIIRLLKSSPIDIINKKNSKKRINNKLYIRVNSKNNIFWRYYQVDILKNIFIIFLISLSSIYLFKTNYTYYLDRIVYGQYKKFEGNDYDIKISLNGMINTNKGIDKELYNEIKLDENTEYVKGSRYSYGLTKLNPDVPYDKEYFEKSSKASGYMKNVLKGITFNDGGSTYFKSEIIGVDENYINELSNYIDKGNVSKKLMDENSIALYIPKIGEDNKYKVDYKVGDYIELYMPKDGNTSEYYFANNKLDDNLIKNRFKIVAILQKPPILSDYYTGESSLVPVMSIKNFNKITNSEGYRDIKIKYKENLSKQKKKIEIDKLYRKVDMPGINISNYIEEKNEDFESTNQTIKLQNIVLIAMILLGVVLTGINLLVSINKRRGDYSLLNIIGLSKRRIGKYIFIENFINYILAALVVLVLSTIEQNRVFKEYAEVLLDKNIDSGNYMIIYICIAILVLGLVNINLFKSMALKYEKINKLNRS